MESQTPILAYVETTPQQQGVPSYKRACIDIGTITQEDKNEDFLKAVFPISAQFLDFGVSRKTQISKGKRFYCCFIFWRKFQFCIRVNLHTCEGGELKDVIKSGDLDTINRYLDQLIIRSLNIEIITELLESTFQAGKAVGRNDFRKDYFDLMKFEDIL